jgi:hypothetical protein
MESACDKVNKAEELSTNIDEKAKKCFPVVIIANLSTFLSTTRSVM